MVAIEKPKPTSLKFNYEIKPAIVKSNCLKFNIFFINSQQTCLFLDYIVSKWYGERKKHKNQEQDIESVYCP